MVTCGAMGGEYVMKEGKEVKTKEWYGSRCRYFMDKKGYRCRGKEDQTRKGW
jgi:hypothetical protein